MKIKLFFLIIIVLSSLKITFQKYLIIPFKVVRKANNNINQKSNYNSKENILSLIDNYYFQIRISSNISIGTKNNFILSEYALNTNIFSIENNCISSNSIYEFSKNITNSYEKEKSIKESLFLYTSLDNLKSNNLIEIKDLIINITNYYVKIPSNNCLSTGLQINDNKNEQLFPSFLDQLKGQFIDKYLLSFIFYNEKYDDKIKYDGYLILGEYPHYINNITNNTIVYSYSNEREDNFCLGISFDNIFYNISDKKGKFNIKYIFQSLSAEFNINIDFILGSNEYKAFIIKDFFQEYFNKDICKKLILKMSYEIILCDSSVFHSENITKFPTLKFQNKNNNITFELNYQDLFELISGGNYYIFLVFFKMNYYKSNNFVWQFGINFLKKYLTIFDFDKKMIGFYIKEKNNNNLNEENFEFIKIIAIFIIFLIILYVILLIKKILLKNGFTFGRGKKLANELSDEYEYIPKKKEKLFEEIQLEMQQK